MGHSLGCRRHPCPWQGGIRGPRRQSRLCRPWAGGGHADRRAGGPGDRPDPWRAARRQIAATIHGLDVRYDLGDGHPLVGRRMPDLDLATAAGPVQTYSLLHRAQPTLLNLGGVELDAVPWADRVQSVEAHYDGAW